MSLRDRLIQFRAMHNLTQKEVAEKIGISREIIMRTEAGKKTRPISQWKIENYLQKNKQ